MAPASDYRLWLRFERYLKAGKLIPVLGPGCITFGEDDTLLYPWLAAQLVERLGIVLPADGTNPTTIGTVTAAHLAAHGMLEDLCMELDILLDSVELKPGAVLRDFARIGAFSHFITLGFDPLLERALSQVRYGGAQKPRIWEFSLGQPPEDLPFGTKDAPHTLLAYLFGRVSPNPGFHLWDHDAIEFVWSLQRALPSLNTLATTFATNNLLFLGTDFSDWLARFFLRVVKNKPLNEDRRLPFLLAESRLCRDAGAILFYDALGGGIEIIDHDPLDFARTFASRALEGFALSQNGAALALPPAVDRQIPKGAIFVSYAHTDRTAAFALVEGLRERGCLVWLDEERLQAGENFDNHLEDAVNHCGLFLSVISRSTEGRAESYFHKERRWAAKRAEHFSENEVFYVPVAIDDVSLPLNREPRAFAKIEVEQLAGGAVPAAFAERLRFIQERRLPSK
jgi:hypothetical protein